MKRLQFASMKEATNRSRTEWEKVLGRPRRPEDETEFMWLAVAAEEGAALLIPEEQEWRLTANERAQLALALFDA